MYDHFRSITSQNGIMTMASEDIDIWTNPDLTPIPPTLSYSPDDFETLSDAKKAYNTMSHAIATKLGNVTFGATFHDVRYIVHKHEKDGFRMLYNLLKISHPRLTCNKAI